jgi:FdhD protein
MVAALRDGRRDRRPDEVVGEEPLEIRVDAPGRTPEPVAVTMRTPGHDFELAAGFLMGEGVTADQREIRTVRYCGLTPGDPQEYNVVTVSLAGPFDLGPARRQGTITAACGVCGTATLDQLYRRCRVFEPGPSIDAELLMSLPDRLRARQRLFERTGGLHAAGLFHHTGRLLAVREDIGRHNAVDKLVGWAALQRRLPLADAVLVVSGRVSFEIVQKAAVAGIPTLVAVSAPSSLAVATASRLGMTLAAFVRPGRANLYAGADRVTGGGIPGRCE